MSIRKRKGNRPRRPRLSRAGADTDEFAYPPKAEVPMGLFHSIGIREGNLSLSRLPEVRCCAAEPLLPHHERGGKGKGGGCSPPPS